MRLSLPICLRRIVARLLSLHWLPHRQCLSRQKIIVLVLRNRGIRGCSHEVRMHRLLLHVFYIACRLLIHYCIVLQLRILLYCSSGRSTSQSERVKLCSVGVKAQCKSCIVYFRYNLRPFNACNETRCKNMRIAYSGNRHWAFQSFWPCRAGRGPSFGR